MNETPELLIEHWGVASDHPNAAQNGVMVESLEKNGNLYIEGTFLQAEVVNGNKRLYPKRVLEKAINTYVETQVNTRQALGELNHPARANVDPLHAAIIIEKLWWEGNDVKGRARIIEGDGAEGDKTAALIRAGWVPGVSSRGLGTVKRNSRGINEVQDGFKLTVGVDVVWGPSAPNAYVKPVVESKAADAVDNSANKDDSSFLTMLENMKKLV